MSAAKGELQQLLALLRPALDASLDPVCVVNPSGEIIYADAAMRALLGLRARDLKSRKVFCNLLQLSSCQSGCKILHVLKGGGVLRLDEVPGVRKGEKLRVSLKAVPLRVPGAATGSAPVGAIVTVRDSTAEILLQAKYHKLLAVIQQKDRRIEELQERIEALQATLRHARSSFAA
jgi:PAS domain-containing protein